MPVPAKRRCFASNWPLFAAAAKGRCVELGLPAVLSPWVLLALTRELLLCSPRRWLQCRHRLRGLVSQLPCAGAAVPGL